MIYTSICPKCKIFIEKEKIEFSFRKSEKRGSLEFNENV